MKVLHVSSGDVFGGAEQMLVDLTRAQASRSGYAVSVIVFNEGRLASELRPRTCVVVLEETKYGWMDLHRRALGEIRATQPDVVHTHRRKETVVGALAAWRAGVKSIRTIHGAPEFALSWRRPQRAASIAVEAIVGRVAQQRAVVVSRDMARQYRPGFLNTPLELIENGIDLIRTECACERDRRAPEAGFFDVGLFARLVPKKRIDIAIVAAAKIHARSAGRLRLHIYGDGPLRGQLETIAKGCQPGLLCAFRGATSDVIGQMRRMDAILLTSEAEGWPIAVLEAMAVETPVVATPVGGVVEMLADGRCGYLAESVSVQHVAEALQRCVDDADRGRKARLARQRVCERWSAESMAERYDRVYRAVLTGETRSPVGDEV